MKSELSFLISVLTVSVLFLGGCAPAFSTPVPMDVPMLPPTQLPVILPTEPVVYDPMLTISPTNGQAGTLIQVVVSGFLPNVPVMVGMGPARSELIQVAQGTTDPNGSFTAQVPAQGSPGMDLIFAATQEGQPGVLASEPFHIQEISQPVVSISPTSGESGTLVQVVASGFSPNSPVSVGMGPANAGFGQVAQGITDENGVFIVDVPVQGSLGMLLVFAVAVEGQPGAFSTDQFQITGAVPNPRPSDEGLLVNPTPTAYQDMWTTYSNQAFAISLQYPADWQPVPGYGDPDTGIIKYAGINGFFQVNSMDADSIDLAAAAEAKHRLQPYGSQPTIESLEIQGQEARLILPSNDQPAGMQNQAALIVRYPFVATLVWSPRYFILWADWPHIRTIAETIRFTN